jgi:hypothetical protein
MVYFLFIFYFWRGYIEQNGCIHGNNPYKENDIISIEVDTNKKTVHVFINNILQPISLCNVPFPLEIKVCLCLGYLLLFIDFFT